MSSNLAGRTTIPSVNVMTLLKLIILGVLFLFIRRLYLSVKRQLGAAGNPPTGGRSGRPAQGPADGPVRSGKFREEDISDADFEEIP